MPRTAEVGRSGRGRTMSERVPNRLELALMVAGGDPLDPLELAAPRPTWMSRGACVGSDPAPFFPTKRVGARAAKRAARAMCDTCCVRDECLAFAMRDPLVLGVWGGTTEEDRRQLRKNNSPW